MILVPDLVDIERQAESEAEIRFARVLKNVNGDPNAVAFYSVKLRSHRRKQQAEADFVILWKSIVIVVEVKGGGVGKHEGVWYSVDRNEDWHKLREAPMDQARSAMYALREIFSQDGVGWYAHEAVVITPDITKPPISHEWKPTHWLAKDTMNSLAMEKALNDVFEGTSRPPTGRPAARYHDLRTRLFGRFARMPVIDAQRGAIIEEQNIATAGQARVLAYLKEHPRLRVLGGAGTGKSLVLVEAAKQDAGRGMSVLVTFRSAGLLSFFERYLPDRSVDVIPFDELNNGKLYDSVLVDEAQDLMTADVMDKLDTVVVGGRASGRWRMFLDVNNQARVDGMFDEDVYELVKAEAPPVELNLNVRNTRAIVHMVQEYLGADVGDPGIVHGEKVQWHEVEGRAGIDAAESVARRLAADGVRQGDIWIVDASATESAPPTSRGFVVQSPREAKGLESEYVVVCNLPTTFGDAEMANFYVSVTRARVGLHIAISPADKRRIQQLLKARMVNK